MKNKEFLRIKVIAKIFAILLFAILLCPVFILSGCDNQSVTGFQTAETELEVMNFFNTIKNNKKQFINYVETEYDNEIENNLTTGEQSLYSSSISLIQNLLNKVYMVVPVLDFYLNDDPNDPYETEYFNLTDLNISDYIIIEKPTTGSTKSYYKKLSGEDINTYLPATIISGGENNPLKDSIDNTIRTWGNSLNFDVSFLNDIYTIVVKNEFYYPSLSDVKERNSDGIKIKRYDDAKKIAIVYTENTELFSKVIEFSGTGTNTKKIVSKYTGDYTINAVKIGQYEYVYEENLLVASGTIIGSYEIKFVPESSYFSVKYTRSSGNYYTFESYKLLRDIIISRIHKVSVGARTESYDFYIERGVIGKLKKYEVANIERIDDITKINANEFALITNKDKENPIYKKISFLMDTNGFNCESIGY